MHMFFFFKQKTAYDMRISDWSSDVCSSDLTTFSKPTKPPPATSRRTPAACCHRSTKHRRASCARCCCSGSIAEGSICNCRFAMPAASQRQIWAHQDSNLETRDNESRRLNHDVWDTDGARWATRNSPPSPG